MDDVNFKGALSVPKSAAELQPPKHRRVTDELESLFREKYDGLRNYFESQSGEGPLIHGSPKFDFVGLAFKIKSIVETAEGYPLLKQANEAEIGSKLSFAYKRIAGVSLKALQKQGVQLRLEAKDTH